MYDNIIVDGTHLAFRNFFGNRKLEYAGKLTGMPYGFITSLLSIKSEYGGKIYVCWDKGRDCRTKIFKDYKANRSGLDEVVHQEFVEQKTITSEILLHLGVTQVYQIGFEADDIIATLVKKFNIKNNLVVTSDHDLFQLLDNNIQVLRSNKFGYNKLDVKIFMEEQGFHPVHYICVLSLTGDRGDNIAGVPGIGPKKATQLFKENFFSMRKFIEGDDTVKLNGPDKLVNLVMEHKDTVRLAYRLISLKNITHLKYERGKLNRQKLKLLFSQYGFMDFRRPTQWEALMEIGKWK